MKVITSPKKTAKGGKKQRNSEKSKDTKSSSIINHPDVKWTKYSNQRTEWLDRLEKKREKQKTQLSTICCLQDTHCTS